MVSGCRIWSVLPQRSAKFCKLAGAVRQSFKSLVRKLSALVTSYFCNRCYSAPVRVRSIVINLSVCLFVCEHISGTSGPIFTKFFVQTLWWRCGMLCTSGFVDDVTFCCSSDVILGRSLMSMNALFCCGVRAIVYFYDANLLQYF